MKGLFLVCVVFLSVSLTGQTLEKKDASQELSTDSVTQNGSSIFQKKLNKYLNLKKDSIINTSAVFGLEEEKDPNIDLLIQDYVDNKKFMGYRIQIFASNERWEVVKVRADFLKKYPTEKSYIVYQAPNFKVRVGDYEDRLTTHEHLNLIKVDFPSAFIVRDEIEPVLD